jgi:hypothetical protein
MNFTELGKNRVKDTCPSWNSLILRSITRNLCISLMLTTQRKPLALREKLYFTRMRATSEIIKRNFHYISVLYFRSWLEWTFSVLTVIQLTATLTLQTALKIQKFLQLIFKLHSTRKHLENIFMATEARFPPDSRLPQSGHSARHHRRRPRNLVCISWYQNRYLCNLTAIFSQRTNGACVQYSITGTAPVRLKDL